MDVVWILIVVVFAWRVLSSEYFRRVIRPADPFWAWVERKFSVPYRAQLAFYRAFFFYGVCRTIAWSILAHAVVKSPWDLSFGGAHWIVPFEPW